MNTAVAYLDSARTLLERFDQRLLSSISGRRTQTGTQLARLFTRAGDPPTWFVHFTVVAIVGGRQHLNVACHMAVALLLATAVSQLTKRTFARARPQAAITGFTAASVDPDACSFPSGHTTVAFAVAIALLAVMPGVGMIELALAGAIGASRVYLGAHYPLDVVAGAVLGSATGVLTRMPVAGVALG